MIQITDQRDDEDGEFSNGEQHIAPVDESEELEDKEDRVHNQGNDLLIFCSSL